jgi:hypothetical protein
MIQYGYEKSCQNCKYYQPFILGAVLVPESRMIRGRPHQCFSCIRYTKQTDKYEKREEDVTKLQK